MHRIFQIFIHGLYLHQMVTGMREGGEMGWFGLSDATVESHQIYTDISSHIINETDPEYYITIVDCHI